MDMKSGKPTTGKPSTLSKIAISEFFFSSIARRWTDEDFYQYTQQYHGWSLEYCLFLDYLKTIQIRPTTLLKENDCDTEAISY